MVKGCYCFYNIICACKITFDLIYQILERSQIMDIVTDQCNLLMKTSFVFWNTTFPGVKSQWVMDNDLKMTMKNLMSIQQ